VVFVFLSVSKYLCPDLHNTAGCSPGFPRVDDFAILVNCSLETHHATDRTPHFQIDFGNHSVIGTDRMSCAHSPGGMQQVGSSRNLWSRSDGRRLSPCFGKPEGPSLQRSARGTVFRTGDSIPSGPVEKWNRWSITDDAHGFTPTRDVGSRAPPGTYGRRSGRPISSTPQ
jgi:hypothetical protein